MVGAHVEFCVGYLDRDVEFGWDPIHQFEASGVDGEILWEGLELGLFCETCF